MVGEKEVERKEVGEVGKVQIPDLESPLGVAPAVRPYQLFQQPLQRGAVLVTASANLGCLCQLWKKSN